MYKMRYTHALRKLFEIMEGREDIEKVVFDRKDDKFTVFSNNAEHICFGNEFRDSAKYLNEAKSSPFGLLLLSIDEHMGQFLNKEYENSVFITGSMVSINKILPDEVELVVPEYVTPTTMRTKYGTIRVNNVVYNFIANDLIDKVDNCVCVQYKEYSMFYNIPADPRDKKFEEIVNFVKEKFPDDNEDIIISGNEKTIGDITPSWAKIIPKNSARYMMSKNHKITVPYNGRVYHLVYDSDNKETDNAVVYIIRDSKSTLCIYPKKEE